MSYYGQSGFSLIEMMAAVTILAIALAIGVPNFQEFIANTQIRTVTESIRNGLQAARSEAVKRNAAVTFTLNNDTSWVVSCAVVTAACPANIQSKSANEGSGAAITIAMLGTNSVRFTSLGFVDPTVPGQLSQVSIDNNRLPIALSRDLRLRIGAGGNIRVCDPNVADITDTRFCS